jgi:hypothetical protein
MNQPTHVPGFTFADYRDIFRAALQRGYRIITVAEFFQGAFHKDERVLVNRIDVDVKIDRLRPIGAIFRELGVKASIYVRLHAPTYNLLGFGNIALVRRLIADGHEIGLHTELSDAAGVCGLDGAALLRSELELFERIFGQSVVGTAAHGDMTPYNNLHFWQSHSPSDFGLTYEAYDEPLWKHSLYVSDSEWTRWKAYLNGELLQDDRRHPAEHFDVGHSVVYLLTHPESWYDDYIHE